MKTRIWIGGTRVVKVQYVFLHTQASIISIIASHVPINLSRCLCTLFSPLVLCLCCWMLLTHFMNRRMIASDIYCEDLQNLARMFEQEIIRNEEVLVLKMTWCLYRISGWNFDGNISLKIQSAVAISWREWKQIMQYWTNYLNYYCFHDEQYYGNVALSCWNGMTVMLNLAIDPYCKICIQILFIWLVKFHFTYSRPVIHKLCESVLNLRNEFTVAYFVKRPLTIIL